MYCKNMLKDFDPQQSLAHKFNFTFVNHFAHAKLGYLKFMHSPGQKPLASVQIRK